MAVYKGSNHWLGIINGFKDLIAVNGQPWWDINKKILRQKFGDRFISELEKHWNK